MKQGAEVVAVVVSAIMAAEVEELLVVALAAA
jgi:hypothetical protein